MKARRAITGGLFVRCGSCQVYRVAIEARLDDLLLPIGQIAQPLEAAEAPLRVNVFTVRICDVPVEPFVPAADSLHGGGSHAAVMATGANPKRLIFRSDAATDFAIVTLGTRARGDVGRDVNAGLPRLCGCGSLSGLTLSFAAAHDVTAAVNASAKLVSSGATSP